MSIVVSDTTPLNYLVLIGSVEVLPRIFETILIPPAVVTEMHHPKTPTPVADWARNLPDWVEVKSPSGELHLGIGNGEDEAISLAVELGNVLILMDDKKARSAAVEQGLLPVGTLAILDLADEAGLLSFEEALERLKKTSFHIDSKVAESLVQKARSRRP